MVLSPHHRIAKTKVVILILIASEMVRIWLLAKQNCYTIHPQHSLVLLKEFVGRYDVIPHTLPSFQPCFRWIDGFHRPIRQVADHRVDAPVWYLSHPLQAVLIVDFIQFYHNVPFRLKPLSRLAGNAQMSISIFKVN